MAFFSILIDLRELQRSERRKDKPSGQTATANGGESTQGITGSEDCRRQLARSVPATSTTYSSIFCINELWKYELVSYEKKSFVRASSFLVRLVTYGVINV